MVICENECFRFERYDVLEEPSFAIISQGDALDTGVTLQLEENFSKPKKYTEIKVIYTKLPPVNPFEGLTRKINAEISAMKISQKIVKYLKENDLWVDQEITYEQSR